MITVEKFTINNLRSEDIKIIKIRTVPWLEESSILKGSQSTHVRDCFLAVLGENILSLTSFSYLKHRSNKDHLIQIENQENYN